MKKYLFRTALCVLALGAFTACSDDDNEPEGPGIPVTTVGAYILNTGGWGQNNGTIQWYELKTGEVSGDLFATANGRGIGDAQDLCAYGSKLYITSSTSAKIEVLNRKDYKIIKTLSLTNDAGQPVEPRYLTATGGNVYFTAYDGTVSRLDTVSLNVTGKIEVGDHPEALTHANGKLYVNLSNYMMDGNGKFVAVVDVASFTKKKNIEVKLNPYSECITAADGSVYFVSSGNHASSTMPEEERIYQTMQRIDPTTDAVTDVCRASYIANKGDKMYILYAEYNFPDTRSISVYDLNTNESKPFIEVTAVPNPSFIDVDPVSGEVYIGNRVSGAKNEVYIFTESGKLVKKIEAGYETSGVFFQTN